MTDKELLKLAAKAMGYKWNESTAKKREEKGIVDLFITEPTIKTAWNPLDNSQYAFDLAVKLRIDIHFIKQIKGIYTHDRAITWIDDRTRFDEPMLDEMAATRRAVVRAAAEIGKQLNP